VHSWALEYNVPVAQAARAETVAQLGYSQARARTGTHLGGGGEGGLGGEGGRGGLGGEGGGALQGNRQCGTGVWKQQHSADVLSDGGQHKDMAHAVQRCQTGHWQRTGR
jgi:hypothetical protein